MPNTSRPRLAAEQGFTLIEFMVAALVMSLVLGSAVVLATQMQQVYTSQQDDAALEQEARYALDWIARDLRSAASDAYSAIDPDQEFAIDPDGGVAADDSIRIQADVNPPDGAVDDNGEDVTIALDPLTGIITREDTVAGVTEEMTDGIFTDLRFVFLDRTRTVTIDPTQVAYVQVFVTAESRGRNAILAENRSETFSTEVRLRARR